MALVSDASQGEVWLVSLDPVQGSEIRKTRPCLVVSPNEMNGHLRTVIIAPMTTAERPYPTRVPVAFQGKRGQVALDQSPAFDHKRWLRNLAPVAVKAAQAPQRPSSRCFSVGKMARQ